MTKAKVQVQAGTSMFAALPLAGRRVLITRAKEQAGSFRADLERAGAKVVEIPSIEIRPPRSFAALDSAMQNLGEYDWLILTSVNGVKALFERAARKRVPVSAFSKLRIAAIGPATKKAIEERGLKVRVVPKEYVAESVVESLQEKVSGKRVLLVRARVARDVIPNELRKVAASVDVVEAYETVVPEKSRTKLAALLNDEKKRPHVVTFTSSSTASNFARLLGGKTRAQRALRGVALASIGPVTTRTLTELGLPPNIEAREYTMPGLLKAIADWNFAEMAQR